MAAVAWIISRDARIVSLASGGRGSVSTFIIDLVLPNGKRVSGEVEAPTQMSLLWLDAFAGVDPNETAPTDDALGELVAALRSGQITARGLWTETGERRDLGADEWPTLVFDSLPRQAHVLLPHRIGTALAKMPEPVEGCVLPQKDLVTRWPVTARLSQSSNASEGVTGTGENQAGYSVAVSLPAAVTEDRSRRPSRGGRPAKWDWAAFDREMLRLANTPDGLPDRPALHCHMLDWCANTWEDSPSENEVRGRIADRYPD